jgi:predicted nucleic acid-binding protein
VAVLTDSSVWIDYFNGVQNWQTDRLDLYLAKEQVIIGDLILTEVLRGLKHDKDYKAAKTHLLYLPIVRMLDTKIALKSADQFRILRKQGITVRKTIDTLIGTYCIENDLILLHNDKDFEVMIKPLGLKTVVE